MSSFTYRFQGLTTLTKLIMLVITVLAIALLFRVAECKHSTVVRNRTSHGAVDL